MICFHQNLVSCSSSSSSLPWRLLSAEERHWWFPLFQRMVATRCVCVRALFPFFLNLWTHDGKLSLGKWLMLHQPLSAIYIAIFQTAMHHSLTDWPTKYFWRVRHRNDRIDLVSPDHLPIFWIDFVSADHLPIFWIFLMTTLFCLISVCALISIFVINVSLNLCRVIEKYWREFDKEKYLT